MLRFQLIRRIFVCFVYVVYLAEDFSDNEELFAKDITKWNSNDLMDKIETIEVDEAQGKRGFLLDRRPAPKSTPGGNGAASASIRCTVTD